MYKRYSQGWTKHLDFVIIELLTMQFSFIIACLLRLKSLPYTISIYRNMGLILTMADFITIMAVNTLHDVLKRGYLKELSETIKHTIIVFLLVTAYMFVTQLGDAYSRLTITFTCLIHIPLSYGTRLLWKLIILQNSAKRVPTTTMLVLTDEENARNLIKELTSNKAEARAIVGIILREPSTTRRILGIPVVATLDNAADYICREWIDSVYVDCLSSNPQVAEFMENCRQMAIPVHYHVPGLSRKGAKQFVERMGDTTVVTTTINYATPMQALEKRVMDLIGGVIGSIIAVFIIAIIGPKIKKASPGPILYRQTRIGQNGKKFKIIKIRSMYPDADARKQEFMEQNRIHDGKMFKLDWDPRVIGNEILPDGTKKTGIGEFIRRTSLDEFPQFFNVLKGEMSIVGTRPPTEDEWNKYEFHHRARLACRPGITGLWQISGRSEITDFEEVVKLDTDYISNWSIRLDIRILIKTIAAVWARKGAL